MTTLYTTYKDFPKEQQQWIKDIDERLERERIQREIESYKKSIEQWQTSNKPKEVIDRAVELCKKRLAVLEEKA